MDQKRSIRENEKNIKITKQNSHINELKRFIKKILKFNQKERSDYMKNISYNELNLIKEIVYNILRGTVPLDYETYLNLKRVRVYLYSLSNEKVESSKKLLQSLKGLRILNLILPIVLEYIAK